MMAKLSLPGFENMVVRTAEHSSAVCFNKIEEI